MQTCTLSRNEAKEKYDFQATIEFEYPVPEGSTLLAELSKCVQFCADALS